MRDLPHTALRPTTPADPLALAGGRVHEAQGRGRRVFALFQAARHPGQVVWILPDHAPQMVLPAGLPEGLPARLMLLRPRGETDLLWSLEETLRAAPVALVIAEPEKPLTLSFGRQLQLVAEAQGKTGQMLMRDGQPCMLARARFASALEQRHRIRPRGQAHWDCRIGRNTRDRRYQIVRPGPCPHLFLRPPMSGQHSSPLRERSCSTPEQVRQS